MNPGTFTRNALTWFAATQTKVSFSSSFGKNSKQSFLNKRILKLWSSISRFLVIGSNKDSHYGNICRFVKFSRKAFHLISSIIFWSQTCLSIRSWNILLLFSYWKRRNNKIYSFFFLDTIEYDSIASISTSGDA